MILAVLLAAALFVAVCAGSVGISISDTFTVIKNALTGADQGSLQSTASIILTVRIPRALCVALTGAALSISGAAMQGLLKNPLADGSTLGVSSGASLGAVIALAFGITLPGSVLSGRMVMAILFAAGTLLLILGLSYRLDSSLSTNTIILVGVIFSMLASSFYSLVITFAGEKAGTITFWMLGSLRGACYTNALVMLIALAVCSAILLFNAGELNAFAIGEENAKSIGVNVRRTRVVVLIAVSIMIGVCVSIGGTIGFVGLMTPHLCRRIFGPNHKKLLPASLFGGAILLLMADVIARTIMSPRELPIGVVTSIVGSIAFIIIFMRERKK